MTAARLGLAVALACVSCAAAVAPARAQWRGEDSDTSRVTPDTLAAHAHADSVARPAGADTSRTPLERFLGGLADSTDRRFGAIAAPLDTSGFAAVLATANLDSLERAQRRVPRGWNPWWRFDRTVGDQAGLTASLGGMGRRGQLGGSLGYGFSSREWFGRGEVRKLWGPPEGGTHWVVVAGAGREVGTLDRDRDPTLLVALGAFLHGADWQSYLRRDGGRISLERESPTLRVRVGARSELESPRTTATEWNLAGDPLQVVENTPARLARVRELGALGTWRLPWSAWWVEAGVRHAMKTLGGDAAYTRTRAALAGKLGLGHLATLVPQATYGRAEGDLEPQNGFWLGGPTTLRSIPPDSRIGRRSAFGRLELFGAPDLLEVAHIPHSPLFAVYAAAQIASGAVWGDDPLGGPSTPGHAWPDPAAWYSETGFSLMYRPGLPEPEGFLRFDWATGLGPDSNHSRWSIQFSTPLDQLRPPMVR
ncbi:MAG TPA: hypothetical protein VLV15_04425 [Dongiaceae bacterium]|nr:hypothetical protein [Dongiaceae bacterium]